MLSLTNKIRAILPTFVKQQAKKMFGLPMTRLHPDWGILSIIPINQADHTVIDLGARNGWFFSCWKDYQAQATVHAFEPDESAYNRLQKRFGSDPKVHL